MASERREKDVSINLAVMHATLIIGITNFLNSYPPDGQDVPVSADVAFWVLGIVALASGIRISTILLKHDYLPQISGWISNEESQVREETRRFLTTRDGFVVFSIVCATVFGSFLMMADMAPPFLSFFSPEIEGISVAPADSMFPGALPIIYIFVSGGLLALYSWKFTIGINRFGANISAYILMVVFLSVMYLGIFSLSIWLPTGIKVAGRAFPFSNPKVVWVVLGGQGVLLGLTATVYTLPVVPEDLQESDNPTQIDRYMLNQWRFARTVLTLAIALVVGIALTTVVKSSEFVNPIGVIVLTGALLPPLLAIVLFIGLRLHRIEDLHRD